MARKVKSIDAQIREMARCWPGFDPMPGTAPHTVIWFGNLKGLDRVFRLSVEYGLPVPHSDLMCRMLPLVRVLSPTLVLNFNAEDESPLPHVHFEGPDYTLSPLCLFDPKAGEWDPTMYIAKTIIPWSARWLACYEIWEAIGRWYGGGRHEDQETIEDAA